MKTIHVFTSLLLSIALLQVACKSDTKPTTTKNEPTPTVPASVPGAPKPEVCLYTTAYDAVLLRETPDLKGKVVTKLPFGACLEGSGERSAEQFEATLGGVNWTEPFYKVNETSSEKKSGWVFGGAIEPIYAGTQAGRPDAAAISAFAGHLAKLDIKKLASGESAWAYVRQNHGQSQGALADAIYGMLERYLRRMEFETNIYKHTESIKWSQADFEHVYANDYDMTKNATCKALDASGFRLATAEGMIFPVVDSKKMLDFFGNKVTPAMKQYLEQSWVELAEPSMTDAHLAIPLEQLADRGIFWENFNRANPYFVRSDETTEHASWVGLTMINGLVFDSETKAPTPDYVKAWAYVQSKYPNTQLGKDIAEFTKLLAAEGNKQTPKVEAFQNAYAKKYNGVAE